MMLKLAIYFVATFILAGVMLGLSWVLGPKRPGAADRNPFESGILPLHDTHIRMPSQFYLIAMFFVIFDLEMVFVFAWAVAVRQAGWPGYFGMLAFLAFLLLALVYLWRSGGLEWRPRRAGGPRA
jgi:NADH-quinone oxidoreductase subunit A